MFYKKTLEFIQENTAISLAKKSEQITALQKRCEQLEKRINTLSDYIQGPYTKQINQNFAEIQMQLKMTEPTKKLKKYYKQFDKKKVNK